MYTKNEEEVAQLWGAYEIDQKFLYYDSLIQISNPAYGKPNALLQHASKIAPNPKLNLIKEKLSNHLRKSDLSVEEFFRFLDKNKSAGINIEELSRGTKDLFTEEEARIFFLEVDKDKSGEISYSEIISECSRINCQYVLGKIKRVIEDGKKDPGHVFDTFDSNKSNQMEITEFNELVNYLYANVSKDEIDSLFKHFDLKGQGRISKDDFKKALYMDLSLENKLIPSLHDIMTPLKTLLDKFKLTANGIFDKFTKDKKTLTINDFK